MKNFFFLARFPGISINRVTPPPSFPPTNLILISWRQNTEHGERAVILISILCKSVEKFHKKIFTHWGYQLNILFAIGFYVCILYELPSDKKTAAQLIQGTKVLD